MRLASAVLLSVGSAVIVGAIGRLSFVSEIPPLFLVFMIPCAIFFGVQFSKYEEDLVLLPFAGAGAMFSFSSPAVIGVGILMLGFAAIGLSNAKADGKVVGVHPTLFWVAASVVCVLAPIGALRLLPMLVSEVLGMAAFAAGAFVFHLYWKANKNKNELIS